MEEQHERLVRKEYLYEGKPGRIKVDGVEVDVSTLTDGELIAAVLEALLRRMSDEKGIPVSDLRKLIHGVQAGAVSQESVNTDGQLMVNFRKSGPKFSKGRNQNGKPVLVHEGQNRHARRMKAALQRRAR